MKRSIRKSIAIVLAVAITVSMMPVMSFAGEATPLSYVALGDSMSQGYMFNDYNDCNAGYKSASSRSSIKQFADMLVEDGYELTDLSFQGFQSDMLWAMIQGYDGSMGESMSEGAKALKLSGCAISHLETYRKNAAEGSANALNTLYTEALKNADVITYDVGMSNIGIYLYERLMYQLAKDSSRGYTEYNVYENENIENLVLTDEQKEEVAKLKNQLQNTLDPLVAKAGITITYDVKAIVQEVIDATLYTCAQYMIYTDLCLNWIFDNNNKDVKVIVGGLYNPLPGLSLKLTIGGKELSLPVSKVLDVLAGILNSYISGISKNSERIGFADMMPENAEMKTNQVCYIETFSDELARCASADALSTDVKANIAALLAADLEELAGLPLTASADAYKPTNAVIMYIAPYIYAQLYQSDKDNLTGNSNEEKIYDMITKLGDIAQNKIQHGVRDSLVAAYDNMEKNFTVASGEATVAAQKILIDVTEKFAEYCCDAMSIREFTLDQAMAAIKDPSSAADSVKKYAKQSLRDASADASANASLYTGVGNLGDVEVIGDDDKINLHMAIRFGGVRNFGCHPSPLGQENKFESFRAAYDGVCDGKYAKDTYAGRATDQVKEIATTLYNLIETYDSAALDLVLKYAKDKNILNEETASTIKMYFANIDNLINEDSLKEAYDKCVELAGVISKTSEKFQKFITNTKKVAEVIKEYKETQEQIRTKITDRIAATVQGIGNAVKNIGNMIVSAAQNFVEGITNAFRNIFSWRPFRK